MPLPGIKPRLIDIRGHYLALILTTRSPENQETVPFEVKSKFYARASFVMHSKFFNLLEPDFFFNFSTSCIQNVNNTGTK